MARTVRDARLESKTARAGLKPSDKPYFRAIDEGLHLGYRKGKRAGKWVMRMYIGDQTYHVETIALADDTLDADGSQILSFNQAQALARNRFLETRRRMAGIPHSGAGPYTVENCITEYLAWLEGNRKSASDAKWRAEALILPSLGRIDCAKLTTKQLREWRDTLAASPPRLRSKKTEPQKYRDTQADDPAEARRRRRASANRTLTILKAAFNRAWREQKIENDKAWRALEPFEAADAARVRYLKVEECQRLIGACPADFRKLVQAALMTGCRFGELATLQVSDFNSDAGTLHIRTSKSGKGRHVILTEEGSEFFRALAAGQARETRLLTKEDGSPWLKSHQSRPMAAACRAAEIAPPINFHALRHTYASLSVMNGAPLMVVARNLGHADTRMVEKHYGHLSDSYLANAIRAAAPRFGSLNVSVGDNGREH